MKKLICFTILVLTFCSNTKLTAQSYDPLVVDSANYIIIMDDYVTLHLDDYWGNQILGDTIDGGKTYKKVYKLNFLHPGYVFSVPNPLILTGKVLQALIREENKIVYAKNINAMYGSNSCAMDTSEYILYNFNLSIGDSTDFCLTNNLSSKHISDTSVVTYDSVQYKTYIFDTFVNDYLIEGIGSDDGLLTIMGCSYKGACTYLYNYSRGPLYRLSVVSNDKIIYSNNSINIFPNPSSDNINIKIDRRIDYPISITIYNVHGEKIKQINSNTNETNIDINEIAKGIYEIMIIGENLCFNEKLVKL